MAQFASVLDVSDAESDSGVREGVVKCDSADSFSVRVFANFWVYAGVVFGS